MGTDPISPLPRPAAPLATAAALMLVGLMQTSALAQALAPIGAAAAPIESAPASRSALAYARVAPDAMPERRADRFAAAIAASAHHGLIDDGVAVARQALLECQHGDYPGGGAGVLSMPFGRPESRTGHCFR